MLLFRAIAHLNPDIELIQLGVYWAKTERKAYPYGCKIKELFYYVYIALVNEQDINHQATQVANKEWPHEKEVTLFPGAQVTVIGIVKYKKPCQTKLKYYPVIYRAKT